jgi:BTB/POZ domain
VKDIAKIGTDGAYFIDRNPELFDFILEFYRTRQIIIPKSISIAALRNELEYFCIDHKEEGILLRETVWVCVSREWR